METVFLGFQIRSLDPSRFPDEAASKLTDELMEKVEETVRYCLDL
jgi:mRNA interferase MazF